MSFLRQPSGRISALGIGFTLIAGPVGAIMTSSDSPRAVGVSAILLLVGIALSIFGIGLATDEAPGWAAYGVLLGPIFLFGYWFAVGWAFDSPPALYPFLAVGIAAVLVGLRPGPSKASAA